MAASMREVTGFAHLEVREVLLHVVGHGLHGVGVVDAGVELDRDEQRRPVSFHCGSATSATPSAAFAPRDHGSGRLLGLRHVEARRRAR